MTRFISEALGAAEPLFRQGLLRLEAANGNPNADIRLTNDVKQAANNKLRQLGLDPSDTTAEELYHFLKEQVKEDDAILTRNLRTRAATHVSAEADVVSGMIHALKELSDSKRCYALKASSARSIIKQLPPKKAMKQLGYRSVDSFLKHESPLSILAAAWLVEGSTWQQRLLGSYKKLEPSDFENRNITLLQPNSTRWRQLSARVVEDKKHNLLCFKELGGLVFLPFSTAPPAGAVTASLALALHELNEIRAASTFLKLCQVRADFGSMVKTVATDEPYLSSRLLDRAVPWHMVQSYYARFKQHFSEEVFEPHIQLDDMAWHSIEQSLLAIEPKLRFWQDTAHLGWLHDQKAVSLNIADAALNCCNQLPFADRVAHYFQRSLWHELLLRYMRHDTVESSVLNQLQPKLAAETALA